jgi:hypothetical protein
VSKVLTACAVAMLAALGAVTLPAIADDDIASDYPTVDRADYIFGCMQVNGNTREALEKCSCSIDEIASILSHKDYEEAATIMSVRQRGGESVAYMNRPESQRIVHRLKQAQIEGELRCF